MTARTRATWAVGVSLIRIVLFYVPLAWIGVVLFGYAGIVAAAAFANVGALWIALVAGHITDIGPSEVAIVRGPAQWLKRNGQKRRGRGNARGAKRVDAT